MKQSPNKKPAARATAAPKTPAKPKRKPVAEEPIVEEDEIPSHPPEEEVIVDPPVDEPEPVSEEPEPTSPEAPATPAMTIGGEPVDPVKFLGFIESILSTLTFRTVGLVALLTTIGLVLFSLYENRTNIVDKFTTPAKTVTATVPTVTNWVLSEASKQSLISLAKATSVRMVILSDVDLKKNRRIARYYFVDDPNIKLSAIALQTLALPLPVFDYDPKNTEQMIAILSNDFRCDKFADTVYNRFAPELASEFPTVCRLAVPPFVGTFVGFITVGIGPNVSAIELETIRLEVSRIAVEIYMNDVTKKVPASPAK